MLHPATVTGIVQYACCRVNYLIMSPETYRTKICQRNRMFLHVQGLTPIVVAFLVQYKNIRQTCLYLEHNSSTPTNTHACPGA